MKQFSPQASLFGACCLLTVALAQSPNPPSPDPASSTAPATQASPRSFDDTKATAAARFKSLDTDGDERISRAEFALGSPLLLEADPGKASEADKDLGRRAEGARNSEAKPSGRSNSFERFNQLDTNKDGFISLEELAAQDANGGKG